jgi:hypothetical protein
MMVYLGTHPATRPVESPKRRRLKRRSRTTREIRRTPHHKWGPRRRYRRTGSSLVDSSLVEGRLDGIVDKLMVIVALKQ